MSSEKLKKIKKVFPEVREALKTLGKLRINKSGKRTGGKPTYKGRFCAQYIRAKTTKCCIYGLYITYILIYNISW